MALQRTLELIVKVSQEILSRRYRSSKYKILIQSRLFQRTIGHPDEGWVNLSTVGSRIQGAHPDFDPRTYGCSNLARLAQDSGGFESKRDGSAVFARRKA